MAAVGSLRRCGMRHIREKQNKKQQRKFKYLKGHDSKGHVGIKGLETTLAFGVSHSPLHWCRIQDGIVTPVSFLVDHSTPGVEN